MNDDADGPAAGSQVTIPERWNGATEVEAVGDDVYLVRRVREDGSVPPLSIAAGDRPILVDVHFGRSAVVRNRIDAVRYGHRESEYRAEFYYLDILNEPQWVQITEESAEHDLGIYDFVDDWVENGLLTEAEARWAREQFE